MVNTKKSLLETEENQAPLNEDKTKAAKNLLDEMPHPCPSCAGAGRKYSDGPCKGHGAGGGSDGGGRDDAGADNHNKDAFTNAAKGNDEVDQIQMPETANPSLDYKDKESTPLKYNHFDLEKLSKLLFFSNNAENGTLIIRSHYLLAADDRSLVRDFLFAVNRAFAEFTIYLQKQGIVVDNFIAIFADNNLKISIPHPKYYDEFIRILKDKNLLLNQKPEAKNELQNDNTINNPSPFSTQPNPEFKKKKESLGEQDLANEQQKPFRPSPFSTKLIKK